MYIFDFHEGQTAFKTTLQWWIILDELGKIEQWENNTSRWVKVTSTKWENQVLDYQWADCKWIRKFYSWVTIVSQASFAFCNLDVQVSELYVY